MFVAISFYNIYFIYFIYSRLEGFQWYTWLIFGSLLLGLISIQPLTWFQFLWTKYRGIAEPRNKRVRLVYDISAKIIRSAKIRTAMYLLISVGLAATSVVNVIGCTEAQVDLQEAETVLSNCVSSWVIIVTSSYFIHYIMFWSALT